MLPLRVRHPEGVSTISVDEAGDVEALLQALSAASGLPSSGLDVKAGYPPRPLLWTSLAQPFASLKLSRDEQLIVSVSTSSSGGSSLVSNTPALKPLSLPTKSSASAAPLPRSTAPPAASPPRAPVTSRAPAQPATSRSADGAFVEVDGSYLVLNIVPDDNSCLFSAVASVFEGGIAAAQKLRKVVSAAIKADPNTFSAVFLEREPDDYIRRIEDSKTWGGAIELSIFAAHYQTEIASVEVASGRIDHFGQGSGYANRSVLVYSGIHYDSCLLSPTPTLDNPEFCETVFAVGDETILQATALLAAKLKSQHYYTDTATFDLRCGVCGQGLKGEKDATTHARTTGHTDFREY